ncbi:hypothetical protein GGF45_003386, partial [Coemansia sp. RSA 551]
MILNAFRKATYEYPFAVWGMGLGLTGPLLVLIVPPIRRYMGYVPPYAVPNSYP